LTGNLEPLLKSLYQEEDGNLLDYEEEKPRLEKALDALGTKLKDTYSIIESVGVVARALSYE
jgi:hypothetical protein